MGAGGATFANALVVTVQDRTSDGAPITWPAEVHPAVRGLIKGFVPCSGLFDAAAHAPRVTFADGAITAVPVAGSPFKEDASLPEHLPQRFTYRYDIRFAPGFGGFGAIAAGGFADVAVDVGGYDRSNNRSSASGAIRLLRSANPYMVDGDPAWLSADTRVFRVEEGASLLGVTLAAGSPDPNAFIQSVLGRFRTNALGASDFDGLPADAALVFFPDVRNVPAGTTRRVFNFALAKVRLRGAAGADDVRAFFRLFRYASPNLVFDPATGYRTHPQAGIERIPLMGFEGTTPGANAISVPFFAERRVTFDVGMQTQTDPANIGTLPPGGTAERYLYFGAFLDINQDAPNARLPLTFVSTAAEANGFTAAQVAPIRDIFYDAHVCMAVELHHPGDVTPTGADPFNSDNLAQRNLVVLKAANPGDPATRQVQHSFEIFTGGRRGAKQRPQALTHAQHEEDDAPRERLEFTTPERIDRMVDLEVAAERFAARHGGHGAHDEDDARAAAVRDRVVQQFPLVFDSAEWTERTDLFDELLIQWNDLPAESVATVHLPGVNCEDVVNLRNLRHAPGDVRIVDSETLELDIGGATYLPVPAGLDARVPGLITIELPDGIRAGQRWTVDVLQLRGGEQRTTGAFQLEVLAAKSAAFAEDEVRLLELLVRRLALLPKAHAWRPVLEARVRHQRERARRLTEDAGDAWVDPTVWRDPGDADDADPRPIEGPRLRVVLERIRVRDDLDPFIKGRGEIALTTTVHSPDNGGKVERHRLPDDGFFRVSDRPGANELELERPIFEGYVARDLRVAIAGGEHDTFDRDDVLGKYTRLFHGDPDEWLGSYGPGDEGPVEPEDMLSWQLWYRIERA
jgi:hypothetical protein